MSTTDAEKIAKVFTGYCKSKGYQIKQSEEALNLRLDISNLKDRTIIKIFYTSKIVIQGAENALKKEIEEFKSKFEANPNIFLSETLEIKACSTTYDIMLSNLREEIKRSLDKLDAEIEAIVSADSNIQYRVKLNRKDSSLTLTQYNNGTLLLQGKTDELFNDYGDLIERIANPSEKEVISRFISSDEETLKVFTARYTPELLTIAEDNVKNKLGIVYDYFELHDKKWFVASECLYLSEITLPEYSPIVMPASKAFEGFAKKLLVGLGMVDPNYFNNKKSGFGVLSDKSNPKRKAICDKAKYNETYLEKLALSIDMHRHFMMHSDSCSVTKIDSLEEAQKKLKVIYDDTKEIFEYFNRIYTLV